MKQFIDKRVKYNGSKTETGLVTGEEYLVTHVYGSNIGVLIGETQGSKLLVSASYKDFEIIGVIDSELDVHSILFYDNEPVGVRLIESNQLFDIGVDAVKGLTAQQLKGFKTEDLIESNGMLTTEEELKTGLPVYDKSEDRVFCKRAGDLLGL